MTRVLLFLLLAFSVQLSGQELVANINQTNAGSAPRNLQSNENWTIFLADTDSLGGQLFYAGPGDNEVAAFPMPISGGQQVVSRGLQLIGDTAHIGIADGDDLLWYTADLNTGTLTEMIRLVDIGPNRTIDQLVSLRNELILIIRDQNSTSRLYKSDGTPGGTEYVGDLQFRDRLTDIAVTDSLLFFTADAPGIETALWRSDGTIAGTFVPRITDEFSTTSPILNLTTFGNRAYFAATDSATNFELYVSDGTFSGTQLFQEAIPGRARGSYPADIQVVEDTLYYRTRRPAGGSIIWKTDGTEAGTQIFAEIANTDSLGSIGNLTVTPSLAYFTRYSLTVAQPTLWRSDGTPAGTYKIADYVESGTTSNIGQSRIATLAGGLYFVAENDVAGRELWYTEGTVASTRLVKDVLPGFSGSIPGSPQLSVRENSLFFVADNGTIGQEVFVSDGTQSGTELTIDINTLEGSSFPRRFFGNGDQLLFTANGACTGSELFGTQGTSANTQLLKDSRLGTAGSFHSGHVILNETVYYVNQSLDFGPDEIWRTDGTPEGTEHFYSFTDTVSGASGGISFPAVFRDKLFLRGFLPGTGQVLLVSNGDPSDVSIVKVLNASSGFNGGNPMIPLNDSVMVFAETDPILGQELWRTDGTEEGTYVIRDINPVNNGSNSQTLISSLTVINNRAYFATSLGFRDWIPYVSDGTEAGTTPLVTEGFFTSVERGRNFTLFSDRVYFKALFNGRFEMFVQHPDGVIDRVSAARDGQPIRRSGFSYKTANGKLYFTVDTDQEGSELWVIDTPGESAHIVADISVGPNGSAPRDLIELDSFLYFSASTPGLGRELYRTDGTMEGTVLVADIYLGPQSGEVSGLHPFQGSVYFSANDGDSGTELWRYNPAGIDIDNDPDAVAAFCPQDSIINSTAPVTIPIEVEVFPNPASEIVNLRTPSGAFAVFLFTAEGKLMAETSYNGSEFTLPVSQYPRGIYLLQVYDSASGRKRIKPLILR